MRMALVGVFHDQTVPMGHDFALALLGFVRRTGPIRALRVSLGAEEGIVLDDQLGFAPLTRRECPRG